MPKKRKRRGEESKALFEVVVEAGVAPDTADPEDELGEEAVTKLNRLTATLFDP